MQGVYKGVRAWSRRTLEKAGERVMDVAGEDDYGEDENPQEGDGAAGCATADVGGNS